MTGPAPVAVIFDWGGTLTPWHDIDLRGQWLAYSRVYDTARAEELADRLVAGEAGLWVRARDDRRSGTLDELFAALGVDLASSAHAEALRAYERGWEPHTLLDPDVPPLLRALRAHGLRIGVLSNTLWTREQHERVFARDGVSDLIDAAVYSSEIAWAKPHPEAFRAAMAAVGVGDPAACVFVGDRPYDDVHGATAVGMRAVLVPHSVIPAAAAPVQGRPDAVVQTLAEVLPVVEAWLEPATG